MNSSCAKVLDILDVQLKNSALHKVYIFREVGGGGGKI